MIIALRTRLKPGHEEEYARDHARIPDDLAAAMQRVGVRDWTIWRSGRDLFHVVDCEDWEAAAAALADDPVDQAWQLHIGRHLEQPRDEQGRLLPLVAQHVWTMAEQLGR